MRPYGCPPPPPPPRPPRPPPRPPSPPGLSATDCTMDGGLVQPATASVMQHLKIVPPASQHRASWLLSIAAQHQLPSGLITVATFFAAALPCSRRAGGAARQRRNPGSRRRGALRD